jgi:dTDP-4-dehydrorhamnose 3,5-epimerase-like enzyme
MQHMPGHAASTVQRTDSIFSPERIADDPRGVIEKLAEGEYHSGLRITSKAGTVRANHYHKHDSHLCYLVRGALQYVTRDARNEQAPLETVTIRPGQLFFTPPMLAHAMVFLEDSEFYCFTTSPRKTQKDYEEDVVRVQLVDPGSVRV